MGDSCGGQKREADSLCNEQSTAAGGRKLWRAREGSWLLRQRSKLSNRWVRAVAGNRGKLTCKGEDESGLAGQEGLVLDALRAANTEGPFPHLVKAGAQAVHHHVVPRHAHELLHLTAPHTHAPHISIHIGKERCWKCCDQCIQCSSSASDCTTYYAQHIAVHGGVQRC